jgi:hypothetical protein
MTVVHPCRCGSATCLARRFPIPSWLATCLKNCTTIPDTVPQQHLHKFCIRTGSSVTRTPAFRPSYKYFAMYFSTSGLYLGTSTSTHLIYHRYFIFPRYVPPTQWVQPKLGYLGLCRGLIRRGLVTHLQCWAGLMMPRLGRLKIDSSDLNTCNLTRPYIIPNMMSHMNRHHRGAQNIPSILCATSSSLRNNIYCSFDRVANSRDTNLYYSEHPGIGTPSGRDIL